MAEYRQLAMDLVAADGVIDDAEIRLMKKHLYADKKIVKGEVDFLLDVLKAVRRKAKGKTDKFDRFLLAAVRDYVLSVKVGDDQVALVRKLTNDDKIDKGERKKFINKIQKETNNASINKIHEAFSKKK